MKYELSSDRRGRENEKRSPYNNSVVPSKYSKFVESGDQIPPRSDIASNEDTKRQNGERVHEAFAMAGALLKNELERIGDVKEAGSRISIVGSDIIADTRNS